MHFYSAAGVEIAYETWGDGPPIVLIHGFASTGRVNWVDTGWVKVLNAAGYRAITFDNRGHGQSTKFYEPASYRPQLMVEDTRRLMEHLGIARSVVMGYSMGARIAALLAIMHPQMVQAAIFSGLAANMLLPMSNVERIAEALDARTLDEVKEDDPRKFRAFAEQTKGDLKALAACMRSARGPVPREDIAHISVPVLVVAGEYDTTAGPVEPLVKILPHAKGVTLPRRNHMNAVGDRAHKEAVLAFLHDQQKVTH